jgi:hypothetical protein
LRVGSHIAKIFGPAEELRNLQMGEVHSFSSRSRDSEIVAKLVSAGYLRPEQHNDRDAITNAIARMKLDLRTGNGSEIHRPLDPSHGCQSSTISAE